MSLNQLQIRLLGVAEGYLDSKVLFACHELGVFPALAGGPASATELASRLEADEDSLERLLNAAVAIGLLTHGEPGYGNSELAGALLVPGGEGYMGNWIALMSRWMNAWTGLTDSVRAGRPVEDPDLHLGGDPDYTRDFIYAMDDYGRLRGREVAEYLDLSGGLRVLDLGGASGTYSVLFAKRWPDLKMTIFDLPAVADLARERLRGEGLADRIEVVGGDYHRDELGEEYDVVFLSDTLHQEGFEDAGRLLRRAHGALADGGRIVLQAMFLDDDRTSPRWPAMHSLILLLVYAHGRAYTVRETVSLLEQAGFRDCEHVPMSLLNVNSLVIGHKADMA